MACARPISFSTPKGPILTRCKQCLNCRIHSQSSLTFRCLLENHVASSGWFLTLTYEDAPPIGDYVDMQRFLDRLRVRNRRAGNFSPVRYFAIGEYGEQHGRFHYHALIWNSISFPPEVWTANLWPYGIYDIGEVSPASARYTCRYTLKFLAEDDPKLPHGSSRKPPLGAGVMKALGTEARNQNHDYPDPPTMLRWGGKTWPVDTAMQIAWLEGYDPSKIKVNVSGTRSLERCSVTATSEYVLTKKFGDPLADYRYSQERRWQKRHDELERRCKL
jgi:hypothetical protein